MHLLTLHKPEYSVGTRDRGWGQGGHLELDSVGEGLDHVLGRSEVRAEEGA